MSLAEDFWELFQGRTDIYGNGGNPAKPFKTPTMSDPSWWMDQHLASMSPCPLGVYPLVNGDVVHWGCIDFDEGYDPSLIHAQNVQQVLNQFGIYGWIEKTRSKGYHVWVFANTWVSAKTMREALLAACQLVDAPTKEINPKQISLDSGGVGNFVRLPYPGGQHGVEGQQGVRDLLGVYFKVENFVKNALSCRCSVSQLERLAQLYQPPRSTFVPRELPPELQADWPALVNKIIEDDPREHGRSDQMCRIAYIMRDEGFTSNQAYAAVQRYDDRWGKYVGRRDRDERLSEIVERAY